MPSGALFFTGSILILVGILVWYAFNYSIKESTHSIGNSYDSVKIKYNELYEFVKERPLFRRKLSDEFLPFSIAFGLNNYWHKEFGLDPEAKIDRGEFGVII